MKGLPTTFGLTVLAVFALVSICAPAVFGQENKTSEAKPAIDEITAKKVDKLFEKWDKPESPGCALGIVKDGRLIYKRGYGMANLDYNIPISSKTVFDIMSMEKQFTAMSILLLAKQGKLSLDDEIQKYLPEVPRYQSPITIRHLIHHTSGIRDSTRLAELAGMWRENVGMTIDDRLGWIARQKDLNFKPGDGQAYSNTGYFLLYQIVKRVSGRPLHEFAVENIFKPLRMHNTQFVVDESSVVKNRVTPYLSGGNGGFSVHLALNYRELDTTVEDLFLWDQNFYNNKLAGGASLISEQLSTGTLNNGEKLNYAFGLIVGEYKGLKTIGHGGADGGFVSNMIRFPEQNFSVICLCNADNLNPWGLANQTADIFLADQFKKVPDTVKENVAAAPDIINIPEKELASLAGLYFASTNGRLNRYFMKDGKLMVQPNNNTGPIYELQPLSRNRFKVVGASQEIVFVSSPAGGPMRTLLVDGGKTTGTRDRVQEVSSSIRLTEFSGKYVSDELAGAAYTLSIKDEKLLLEVRNGYGEKIPVLKWANGSEGPKDTLLTPAFTDAFFTSGERAILRFRRNQQNAVHGFTLTVGNSVRRLRFNKQ